MRPRVALIVWHLLADPTARFRDLGPDYLASRTDKDKKIRNHIRQLRALNLTPEDIAALLAA